MKEQTRRTVLKQLAAGTTLSALPISGQNVPTDTQQQAAPVTQQNVLENTAPFFNAEQKRALEALTDTIIPADQQSHGAREAKVADYIDVVVADAAPATKEQWVQGLALVEERTQNSFRKHFVDCTPEEQNALLAAMAGNEDPNGAADEKFFVRLKRATIDGYYTSRIGMHEDLRYHGNQAMAEFQGCTHKEMY